MWFLFFPMTVPVVNVRRMGMLMGYRLMNMAVSMILFRVFILYILVEVHMMGIPVYMPVFMDDLPVRMKVQMVFRED
jgi:hypothetical protein